jgi:hypothetical protein
MAILERQYKKLLEVELIRYLLLGNTPNIQDISARIGKVLSKDSNIVYKYIPQSYRSVFNVDVYNRALQEIKFDIDIFNDELVDLFSLAASRLTYADLFHKVNSHELNRLDSALNLLLFINSNADFYFSGASETFSSNSNIDKTQSTKGIIDLSEQALTLPYGGRNTKRIDVGSLVDEQSVDFQIFGAENFGSSSSLGTQPIPQSKFGNVFTDTLDVWGHRIASSSNSEVTMTFTFPLNQDQEIESEYFVTRFEIVPHSMGKQKIIVETSNDNINFIPINGYENGIETYAQNKVYAMDFETTLVQYVRMTIIKPQPDREATLDAISGFIGASPNFAGNNPGTNAKYYEYTIGLKKFAAFQTGRIRKATYISQPIEFKNEETIGKVALSATQYIPPGCRIDYFIGPYINSKITSFIPITPLGQDSTTSKSNILQLGSTERKTLNISVTTDGEDAAQVYGSSFQGIQFYRIGPAIAKKPIFGVSKLLRGANSWFRDASGAFEILDVTDNYVSFEQSDLEAIYALETESPTIIPITSVDDIKRVRLQVTRSPYYDISRGHGLKKNSQVEVDVRPNYAIFKVTHKTDNTRQTQTFTLASSRTQYLPNSNFIIQSNNQAALLPTLSLANGTTYQESADYTFETIDIGGRARPTGRIVIPEGSQFLDTAGSVLPLSLEFSYTIDPDITHKVSSIQNNNVTLEHSSNTPSDSIEIVYRYIPVAPSYIIPASIRVSDLPTTSTNRAFYVEGRDYSIDASSGAIQRIPTGDITTTGSVYVQFSYRGASSALHTFTTWAYIAPSEGTRINFDLDETTQANKLVVDEDLGESFFINTKEGLINLTKSASTPLLPNGWTQFIVRSKNPDTNTEYSSNLIDQVIQIKDNNNKKVFRAFNFYFSEITALRQPLVEATLNHLKVNTLLANHNVFAIDTITDPFNSYVVINFLPNSTSELYSKIPTGDADETNPPQTIDEEFTLTWLEKTESKNSTNKLVVKIELARDGQADGGLTSKCLDYQIRVGP